MASFKRDGVRLNFWLSTGTVGSYLEHPRQGKTQLFRREVEMSQAFEIFQNPRIHTGVGYHRKENQNQNTGAQQEGKAAKPCCYGSTCQRCGCYFDHSGLPPGQHFGHGPCHYGRRVRELDAGTIMPRRRERAFKLGH